MIIGFDAQTVKVTVPSAQYETLPVKVYLLTLSQKISSFYKLENKFENVFYQRSMFFVNRSRTN